MITEADEMMLGKTRAECEAILQETAVRFYRGEESLGVLSAVEAAARRAGVSVAAIEACLGRTAKMVLVERR